MKVLSIIKYVFTFVGVGMLIGAFFLYKNTSSFLDGVVHINGIVVDLEQSRSNDSTTYHPVVNYVTNQGENIQFTSSSGSNPPSYSVGDHVKVLYQPTAPQNAKIDSFFSLWGGTVIVGGLGAVFFMIGGGIMLVTTMKGRRDEYLRTEGTPIETDFQSVEMNDSISVNGNNPYQILTQWLNPTTSELHIFKSNNLWFDPTDHIKSTKIKVYIEQGNPKKYCVDLSFLPKLAN